MPESSFLEKLRKIIDKKDLNFDEAYELFNQMVKESSLRVAAVLSALQTKGYTAEELAGLAKAMRDNAVKLDIDLEVVDTCGTGGDYSNTINVSTAVAILTSCFTPVAKHGNVSVTSKSGSANVLEKLGIEYKLDAVKAKEMIEKTNFTFLFAPLYHPSLKPIMPVRKELGIKTVFNVLGPLCNPANPSYQLLGVSSKELSKVVAEALEMLGVKGLVVHGSGLDEVNPKKETIVYEVRKGIETYTITPEDFGVKRVDIIPCKSAEESASRIEKTFEGNGKLEDLNFVLINASTALYSCGIAKDFREGIEIIRNVISEGKAKEKLQQLRDYK